MANLAWITFSKTVPPERLTVIFHAINMSRGSFFDIEFSSGREPGVRKRRRGLLRPENTGSGGNLRHPQPSVEQGPGDGPWAGWVFRSDVAEEFAFWLYGPGKRPFSRLEWKHTLSPLGIEWWGHEFFASQAVHALGAAHTMYDEGVGKTTAEFFLRYPNLTDWLRAMDYSADKRHWKAAVQHTPARAIECLG